MTVEKWCEEVEKLCGSSVSIGDGHIRYHALPQALQIIRRQQDGLKKIADGYCRKDCDGVDACACDERTATQTLSDCDAIVSGETK